MNNGQSFLLYIRIDNQTLDTAKIGNAHLEYGKFNDNNVAPINNKITDTQFCCFSSIFIIFKL